MQGPSTADIIQGAPEVLIEQNSFYLHIKLKLGQCDQEISTLREANLNPKKEFDDLKARYETLEKLHKYVLHRLYQSQVTY